MKANKKRYLRIKSTKKKIDIKNSFLKEIKDKEYGFSLSLFTIASVLIGVIVFAIYYFCLKGLGLALVAGLFSTTILYLATKLPLRMSKTIKDALEYKEFIFLLESALRNTNATLEALEEVASDDGVKNKVIKETLDNIIVSVKLGDPLETAIEKATAELSNPYLIMVFSIIRINHNLGTGVVLDALTNIQHSMDDIIDNTGLLKTKINSLIGEKTLFIALTLSSPIFMNKVIGELLADFYSSVVGQLIVIVFIVVCFACQFYIDSYAEKVLREL